MTSPRGVSGIHSNDYEYHFRVYLIHPSRSCSIYYKSTYKVHSTCSEVILILDFAYYILFQLVILIAVDLSFNLVYGCLRMGDNHYWHIWMHTKCLVVTIHTLCTWPTREGGRKKYCFDQMLLVMHLSVSSPLPLTVKI